MLKVGNSLQDKLKDLKKTGNKTEKKVKENKKSSVGKKTPQIRIAKNIYYKNVFKKFASFFSYFVLVSVVIYMCFSLTILRVIPSNTNLGFVPVKNMTFPGGIVPEGEQVVMNTVSAQGTTFVDRMKQSFLMNPDVVLVDVLAGPYGKVKWAPGGLTTVDGKPLPVSFEEKPKEFLEDEYIVRCIKGNCVEGEVFIIPVENVYGQPLNKVVIEEGN